MGMSIEEFEEYAKSHNILTMTREFYENRLKADMVAMLTELQLEIEELDTPNNGSAYMDCVELIQQKIDALNVEKQIHKGEDQ